MRRNTRAYRTVACKSRGRSNHRIDAEIGVFKSTELTLKENFLAVLDSLLKISVSVANIGSDFLLILHTGIVKLLLVEQRLVINVLKS